MSTLAEIESAAAKLSRAEQARLLQFVASCLGEVIPASGGRTGAELARRWSALPHLSPEEAAAFEQDLAASRVAERPQAAPGWE